MVLHYIQMNNLSLAYRYIHPEFFRIYISYGYSSHYLQNIDIFIHSFFARIMHIIYIYLLNDMDISIVCNLYIYIHLYILYTYKYTVYIYILTYIHTDILPVACFTLRSWLAKAKFFEMRSHGVPENYRTSALRFFWSRGC